MGSSTQVPKPKIPLEYRWMVLEGRLKYICLGILQPIMPLLTRTHMEKIAFKRNWSVLVTYRSNLEVDFEK
jgi:hypothetical protein